MQLEDQLTSALGQAGVAIGVAGVAYLIQRMVFSKSVAGQSFLSYLGLQSPVRQLDRTFLLFLVAAVFIGVASTFLEFRYSEDFRQLLTSKNSPFGAIILNGFGYLAVVKGLIYCYVQSGGAEEILFRGLIARRLFASLGNFMGNVVQALIFWLMHLGLFRLITGEWISIVQGVAFVTSFGLGLLLGYANIRKGAQSIGPSWILHGTANFATFLTLAAVWK